MKHLVNKSLEKEFEFMGDKVVVKKLSVAAVRDLQKVIKENAKDKEEGELKNIYSVIRTGVVGADAMTQADFDQFPLDELAKLTNEILVFCGLAKGESEGN